MKTLKRLLAVIVTTLLLVSCLPTVLAAPSAAVSGSADVVITTLSASHSTGASAGAAPEGDSRVVMEANLPSPGAWASFTLTVENRGDRAAVLSRVLQQDDTPDNILVSFGISNDAAGETLAPGSTCTITIVAQVDPATADTTLEANGDFSLTLIYDTAGYSPKTGDDTPLLTLFLVMVFSLTALMPLRKSRSN